MQTQSLRRLFDKSWPSALAWFAADLAILGILLFASFLVNLTLPYFRLGVGERVALSPLTHLVLNCSWLIWMPPILAGMLLVSNCFNKFTKQGAWSFCIVFLILSQTIILTVFLIGMSWPCWKISDHAGLKMEMSP